MPFSFGLDNILDLVNGWYDLFRNRFASSVYGVFRNAQGIISGYYEAKLKRSLAIETNRKRLEFEARLPTDTSLSFYDEYEIINGSPVFTIDVVSRRIHQIPSYITKAWEKEPEGQLSSEFPYPLDPSQRLPARLSSFKIAKLKITCFAFSHDDRYLACGMSDGSLSVWDAESGNLCRSLSGYHSFAVSDVAFLKPTAPTLPSTPSTPPTMLVSVDLDGMCIRWEVFADPRRLTKVHCATNWDDSSYVGTELAVPCLSPDGRFVGFPIYTYIEPSSSPDTDSTHSRPMSPTERMAQMPNLYSIVFIFATDAVSEAFNNRVDPLLILPVRIQEPGASAERLVDLVRFSHTSRSVLLTVYELVKGYLVLWPRAEQRDVTSYRLQGTRGVFSPDDHWIVTWHGILCSDDHRRDSKCYVWNLEKLEGPVIDTKRPQWSHPNREAVRPLEFDDPNEGSVHTCGFVRLKDTLGMVSCCLSENLTVIIWSLLTRTPIHVLRTDFMQQELCPAFLRTCNAQMARLVDRVEGLECVTISGNCQFLAVYSSKRRKGVVWKVSEGVEIMRIDVPEDKMDPDSGMDIRFSKSARKLIMVGRGRILLWSPSALRGYNPADRPLYQLKTVDRDIELGESICKFSADGSVIGLMRFNAECMTLWRFYPEQCFELRRPSAENIVGLSQHRAPNNNPVVQNAESRFCQFAVSHDGSKVVTCMGDMSVLLWDINRSTQNDRYECRCIAPCFPYYCPALDVCFSRNMHGLLTVVVCHDHGLLVWIDPSTEIMVDQVLAGGSRSCTFNTEGTRAIVLTNLYQIKIWDIVQRRLIRTVEYKIPLFSDPGKVYNPQLSPNGDFCVLGFKENQSPLVVTEETAIEDIANAVWYPATFKVSNDGHWVIMSGNVDPTTDDILMEEHVLPDFSAVAFPRDQRFPQIEFTEDDNDEPSVVDCKGNRTTLQTWKIVHIDGEFKPKQMRLPEPLDDYKFVVLSPDGRRCAAMNRSHELIVWGTHFTYKSILQQRRELTHATQPRSRSQILEKLKTYGPSLVNHPYEYGMNLVMECVKNDWHSMLKYIVAWALESDVKLAFQGRITKQPDSNDDQEITPNVLDMAVEKRSQETIEILMEAMLDGATSETSLAQIMECSLVGVSYKYPSLVLKLFKSRKFLKSLGIVDVSEHFLKTKTDSLGVTTDKRLVASDIYAQRMWETRQKANLKVDSESLHVTIPAEAKVIPYPNIAKMRAEGILQSFLFHGAQHIVYGTDVIRGVINYKFKTYARALLLEDLVHYFLLLGLYTASCIYVGYTQGVEKNVGSVVTGSLVMIVGIGNFIRFLKQVHALWIERGWLGVFYYGRDYMKWIELISYVMVILFIPIAIWASNFGSELVNGFMAVTLILIWVKLLYYAQAFEVTGPMVVMIREIVKDIRWFLFVLVVFMVSFGVAFFVILGENEDQDNVDVTAILNGTMKDYMNDMAAIVNGTMKNSTVNTAGLLKIIMRNSLNESETEMTDPYYFKSPYSSLWTVFMLMLSDISDIAERIYLNEKVQVGTRVLAAVLLAIFLAAVAIILLNLLIAIMGDSFDRVKNHEKTHFLQKRAEVIQDMEMALSRKRYKEINDKIERYLHVLIPKFRVASEEWDWEGRIVDIQRRMRDELKETSENQSADIQALKDDIKEMKELMITLMRQQSRSGPSGSREM